MIQGKYCVEGEGIKKMKRRPVGMGGRLCLHTQSPTSLRHSPYPSRILRLVNKGPSSIIDDSEVMQQKQVCPGLSKEAFLLLVLFLK